MFQNSIRKRCLQRATFLQLVNLMRVGREHTIPSKCTNEEERMKISCSEVRRELANYMEDDVDAELRSRIERHFRECDGCNALYDSIRKVVRLVGSTEVIELPAGFSRRLYERLSTFPS